MSQDSNFGLLEKTNSLQDLHCKEERIMPELKALKERLTLLLGANAARKFNLKPLLMYHYENPRHLLTS
jgi:hypothetical protein